MQETSNYRLNAFNIFEIKLRIIIELGALLLLIGMCLCSKYYRDTFRACINRFRDVSTHLGIETST